MGFESSARSPLFQQSHTVPRGGQIKVVRKGMGYKGSVPAVTHSTTWWSDQRHEERGGI